MPTVSHLSTVLYGGNNNWFVAYAYWYFKDDGHGAGAHAVDAAHAGAWS